MGGQPKEEGSQRLVLAKFSNILANCDTRDTFTEAIQYSCKLFAGLFPEQDTQFRGVYKSLSESRKIFKLLQFIPAYNDFLEVRSSDFVSYQLTKLKVGLSVAYYFLDNLVWLLETIKRQPRDGMRPYKQLKNRISLLRITVALGLGVYELSRELYQKRGREIIIDRSVKLWHESLRMWLTFHKLHLLSLFISSPPKSVQMSRRHDIVPGTVGLLQALTGLGRKLLLPRLD
jgi:hypothetical protein